MKIVRHVEADQREWLRALRAAYGLTQDDLARVVGVHAVSVARWETSARRIGSRSRVLLNVLARERGLAPLAPSRKGAVLDISAHRKGNDGIV